MARRRQELPRYFFFPVGPGIPSISNEESDYQRQMRKQGRRITVRPCYGVDFEDEIKQPTNTNVLFIYNENVEQWASGDKEAGGGNAKIRPHRHDEAIGVPTSFSSDEKPAWRDLGDPVTYEYPSGNAVETDVQGIIDHAFRDIEARLIANRKFEKVWYSAKSLEDDLLGVNLFNPSDQVREYITKHIRALAVGGGDAARRVTFEDQVESRGDDATSSSDTKRGAGAAHQNSASSEEEEATARRAKLLCEVQINTHGQIVDAKCTKVTEGEGDDAPPFGRDDVDELFERRFGNLEQKVTGAIREVHEERQQEESEKLHELREVLHLQLDALREELIGAVRDLEEGRKKEKEESRKEKEGRRREKEEIRDAERTMEADKKREAERNREKEDAEKRAADKLENAAEVQRLELEVAKTRATIERVEERMDASEQKAEKRAAEAPSLITPRMQAWVDSSLPTTPRFLPPPTLA